MMKTYERIEELRPIIEKAGEKALCFLRSVNLMDRSSPGRGGCWVTVNMGNHDGVFMFARDLLQLGLVEVQRHDLPVGRDWSDGVQHIRVTSLGCKVLIAKTLIAMCDVVAAELAELDGEIVGEVLHHGQV